MMNTPSDQNPIAFPLTTPKDYDNLLENMMDGLVSCSINGKINQYNKAFQELLGYSRSELLEMSYWQITPKSGHKSEQRIIRSQVLQKRRYEVYEKEFIHKNGDLIPVEVRTFILSHDHSNLLQLGAIVRSIAERKKIEGILVQSETNFRELYDFAPTGNSITALNGSLKVVNPAFCDLLGYSKEELQSMTWQDITFQEDWPRSEAVRQSLLRSEIMTGRYEQRLISKKGEIIWIDVSEYLRKSLSNKPRFYITSILNISEKKRIEEESAFKNILLHTQLELSLDGVLAVDVAGSIISYNKRFVEMMGIPEDLMGERSDDLLLQYVLDRMTYPDEFLDRVRYLYKQHQEISFDEILLKDGSIYERYSAPMNNSSGQYYGRVWYFRDITERRKAESKLRESEWKHRIVADNTYDWEFWKTPDHQLVYCSPSCFRITGYTSEEFMNDSSLMEQIIHPGDVAVYKQHLLQTITEDTPLELNYRIIHANGSVKWVAHLCMPIKDENGIKIGRRGSNRDITAQMASEEEIRISQARFRSYFEHSTAGIGIVTSDLRWAEVNDHLCSLLGYSKEELLAKTWADLTYAEDYPPLMNYFTHIFNGEVDGYSTDTRFIHKMGHIIWTSLSVKTVKHPNNSADYFMVLLIDISARKLAEDSLRKSSQELQMMFDNMINAFIIWNSVFDAEGNFVSVQFGFFNEAYAHIAKVDLTTVRGKDVLEVWPETEPSWIEAFRSVALTGGSMSFDMYHKPTGRWYHCSAYRPLESPDLIGCFFEDITNRKLMEEKLAWEQYLIQALMDHIPDYIYFKDLNSRFIRINQSLARVLGLKDPVQALGKTDSDFFMTPHSEEAFQDEQNVIQTGVPLIGKEEMEVWPDRPPTWISTTKMPLIDIHGKCIGTFGISRDITDLKNTLNELMKAKEDAEQSNRLKTAFLHNISHEIRTPLNAIIGFSSILCTGKLSASKKKQFAQIIQVSNDQLLSIISGILALASLETGHEQVTEKRTHLNELMKNVYDQFTINLNNDKVSFGYYCELPDILCEVLTDSVKLMQIIINLVGNALKFTKEGYVKFGYQIINEKIRFYVEDSGIGIPEHLHDQIFNRFVQADNSSTRKYGGAGLGLSLVKGYLQIMDGSIHLTSQPGVGSNFTFYIPYKPAAPKIMPETGKRLYPLKDISPNQDILIAENDRI